MKVVILCGGYGTRIRDVAENIPKPMIPIGNKPILWHIMNYYAGFGFKEFILCLGYKSEIIKDFFINYDTNTTDITITLGGRKSIVYHNKSKCDWEITLAETGLNAMTGARIKRIQKYIEGDENFMLTYGDGVGNINIDALVKFHKSHNKILTVTGVRPPGRFGELMNDKNGKVLEFNEKPQATGGRISGGYFVCRKEIFSYLKDQDSLVFEKEPMKKLVEDQQLMVYEHDDFWQPMDTARDYNLLNDLYIKGEAPWII